jgi:hypothetical protein
MALRVDDHPLIRDAHDDVVNGVFLDTGGKAEKGERQEETAESGGAHGGLFAMERGCVQGWGAARLARQDSSSFSSSSSSSPSTSSHSSALDEGEMWGGDEDEDDDP